jgi:hypothetical protein
VGGHEAYHRSLSGGSHTVWLLPSRMPWSVVWFLGGARVPSSLLHSPEGSPFDRWPLSLAKRGGVIPSTEYPTRIVWLLVELVVSRLLGHNCRPAVPGVQDPDTTKWPLGNHHYLGALLVLMHIFLYSWLFLHYSCTNAYFVLQLHFLLREMGNNQDHALAVFNLNARKVVEDAISYARIQANNQYYKEILGQKMNKEMGSSSIYLTEVKNPKSFDLQHLRLIFIQCTNSIFLQVWIPWFQNREADYFEFCKL